MGDGTQQASAVVRQQYDAFAPSSASTVAMMGNTGYAADLHDTHLTVMLSGVHRTQSVWLDTVPQPTMACSSYLRVQQA